MPSSNSNPSLSLCPADIGRRVTIRAVRIGDGTAFDTVGPLLAIDDAQLTVEGRRGAVTLSRRHDDRLAHIVAGRVVSPEISAFDLQKVAELIWPPLESEMLGNWNLRWAGAGERSDSVRVAGDPGMPLNDAIKYAVSWYTGRNSTALLQVPSPWLNENLEALGAQPIRRVVMMSAHTQDISYPSTRSDRANDLGVELCDTATSEWIELAPHIPTDHRVGQSVYAIARIGRTPVGIGRATVAARWCGITSIVTAPNWQRQGIAQAVTASLTQWAANAGITQCFLQVLEDNEPARALYSRLGFSVHHRYAYWKPVP